MSLMPRPPSAGPAFVNLAATLIDADVARQLPASIAKRLGALLIAQEPDGSCCVGLENPLDIFALDELQATLRAPVRAVRVEGAALAEAQQRVYRGSADIAQLARSLQQELNARRQGLHGNIAAALAADGDAPVVRLLENILATALRQHASDIHLEPQEAGFRIRQRVDGTLSEQLVQEPGIYPALVIRLKLMADIDIAEKRLPQDGRFAITLGERVLKLRIATLPTQWGEAVVLRLLTAGVETLGLSDLGASRHQRQRIEKILADPHGAVLVVGPTGSGKTTTLNALLKSLDSPGRKLVTLEDPIECQLPRATQVQVNPRIGLGFAQVLRSVLRHDPDVIMVGEVRDRDTADIALRAALTGHLVFSTVHCNDAAACLPRLLDMGVEPYVAISAIRLVIAQRLLRRVCPHCAVEVRASPGERSACLSWLGTVEGQFRQGRGCAECNGSGLKGRVALYELLEIDEAMAQSLREGDMAQFARLAVAQAPPLAASALSLAARGAVPLAEALRVCGSSRVVPLVRAP